MRRQYQFTGILQYRVNVGSLEQCVTFQGTPINSEFCEYHMTDSEAT